MWVQNNINFPEIIINSYLRTNLINKSVRIFWLGHSLIATTLLILLIWGLFKVLYRPDGQHDGKLYSTHKHSIEVPIPRDGEYVVEVRAHSDGGDGVVSQVKISGKPIM